MWLISDSVVRVSHDFIHFAYDDFTDIRTNKPYDFNANVLQVFISAWY